MRIETLGANDADGDFIGQVFTMNHRYRWTCDRCHRQGQYAKQNSPMDYPQLNVAVQNFEKHIAQEHGTEI